MRKFKKTIRYTFKFFKWLFKGKSISSNIAFLIFAYLTFRLAVLPLLSYLGIVDIVAVVSGSMHHQPGQIENTYTGWLVFHGFNKSEINNWPFKNGLDIGDAVVVVKGNISVGDVVVYYYQNKMIIHRVVNITEVDGYKYYTTKGDANPSSLEFEYYVPQDKIIGKVGFRIPFIGWPRTLLYYALGI